MTALVSVGASIAGSIRRSRRQWLAVVAALLLVIAVIVVITDPFATQPASSGVADNAAPTAVRIVREQFLTAREAVVGTLGYAETWTIVVPSGTSTADLQHAEQQQASARASYFTAQTALAGDQTALDTAEAELQAMRLKEESDCASSSAAASPLPSEGAPDGQAAPATGESSCVSSMQDAAVAQTVVTAGQQKVAADRAELTGARDALASARHVLSEARAASTAYGDSGSYTTLPEVGDVIHRGQVVYAIDGVNALLFYGSKPAWRSFASGISPGPDVAQLNANLRALGFDASFGNRFTTSTARAIAAFQRARGLRVTGSLLLGAVAFEPGAARVTAVMAAVGQGVEPGPIITLSSTRHSVSVQLDPSQQSQVKAGDRVVVTLPDSSTTPGVVTSVGTVAGTPSGNQSGGSTGGASTSPSVPTIPVAVQLLRPHDAGTLDQAPVNVLITTASVSDALVAPVNALVALAGGGYAVEEVTATGSHELVRVIPGLFDDEAGLVQIKGDGVAAGQRVVVPSS